LVGQWSAAVERHAFLRRADLVRGTAQGAGAVQVHVFVEPLVPGRRPEDLLRVDEESAEGEDGVNAREQIALVRVAEVMDGQRRDHRIERTRGQRVREFLDVQGGLEWRQPHLRFGQHLRRLVQQVERTRLDPPRDVLAQEARPRAQVEQGGGGFNGSRHQVRCGGVEGLKARNQPSAGEVVFGGVPDLAHGWGLSIFRVERSEPRWSVWRSTWRGSSIEPLSLLFQLPQVEVMS